MGNEEGGEGGGGWEVKLAAVGCKSRHNILHPNFGGLGEGVPNGGGGWAGGWWLVGYG